MSHLEKMELLNDPSVSDWFKRTIIELEQRDPLDALCDAELLVKYLEYRLHAVHP